MFWHWGFETRSSNSLYSPQTPGKSPVLESQYQTCSDIYFLIISFHNFLNIDFSTVHVCVPKHTWKPGVSSLLLCGSWVLNLVLRLGGKSFTHRVICLTSPTFQYSLLFSSHSLVHTLNPGLKDLLYYNIYLFLCLCRHVCYDTCVGVREQTEGVLSFFRGGLRIELRSTGLWVSTLTC